MLLCITSFSNLIYDCSVQPGMDAGLMVFDYRKDNTKWPWWHIEWSLNGGNVLSLPMISHFRSVGLSKIYGLNCEIIWGKEWFSWCVTRRSVSTKQKHYLFPKLNTGTRRHKVLQIILSPQCQQALQSTPWQLYYICQMYTYLFTEGKL